MTEQPVQAFRAAGVVVMTIVVIFLILGYGVYELGKVENTVMKIDDAVKLPLLVIAGLVSLIALLAVMAIAFKTVHLANQTQALGLPDGTVRAVIALSLILIFAVVTVYLFSDLTDETPCNTVACSEVAELKGKVDQVLVNQTQTAGTSTATQPPATGTATQPKAPANSNPPGTPPGGQNPAGGQTNSNGNNPPAGGATTSNDARRQSQLAAQQDFAKQLLIMLGTLITSITSFYFGSKTAEASQTPKPPASSTPAPPITIDGVAPQGDSRRSFVITGSGLLGANAVSLRNAAGTTINVDPKDVMASETKVSFTTAADVPNGEWTVTVTNREGTQGSRAKAIVINDSQPA